MAWRDPGLHIISHRHSINNREHFLIKVTELSKTFHEHQFNDPWFVVYLRILTALGGVRWMGGGDIDCELVCDVQDISPTNVIRK